ncbi:hypothetical protein CTAYLR_004520 [Chrysophaeum taylorii]|uniref:HECT-type E3 ubiquitin transferase n=1 Tax=Chrysophaeum taylorii TaxID=2483200 RepID=A0AAD7UMV8_9STRA|nr:hypothetical protein CTAYLR_004520 [Chrysophaeum taylorii]
MFSKFVVEPYHARVGEDAPRQEPLESACRAVCRVLDEEAYDPTESPARVIATRTAPFRSAARALAGARRAQLLVGVDARFEGEEAIDAGGVAREWCSAVAEEVCRTLLEPQNDGTLTVGGGNLEETFAFGKLCGAMIAWCARHTVAKDSQSPPVLSLPLSKVFAKLVTRENVTPTDVADVDAVYYRNRLELALRDLSELERTLDRGPLTFVSDEGDPLHLDGDSELVTPENARQYVAESAEHYLLGSRRREAAAFVAGVDLVLGPKAPRLLAATDVLILLVGVADLDVLAWRDAARFDRGAVDRATARRLFGDFWDVVADDFTNEDRTRLLLFATGAAALPPGGFPNLAPPFTLCLDQPAPLHRLPTSHACFNAIYLPLYPDAPTLRDKLRASLRLGLGSFGLT